jgi:DNA invertase Pin-like site-specific DNA recombinase
MHIGYARGSIEERSTSIEAQEFQLRKVGCEQIYKDENQSGGKRDRPSLNKALEHLRKGDVFTVSKLDRLSRSLVHLLGVLKKIDEVGAKFPSLGEAIETESASGRMMMQMLGNFAELNPRLSRERIRRGLAHARANGRIGGGRYKLPSDEQMEAVHLIQAEKTSQGYVAKSIRLIGRRSVA